MPNLPEGSGSVIRVSVANPGPGADAIFTVPAATRRRILMASVKLVTDANPAHRTLGILSSHSAGTAWAYFSPITTPASTTTMYHFALALPAPAGILLTYVFNPLPDHILMTGTDAFRFTYLNGVIGDELSEASMIVEEWIEP
jgi:hypothetical protein